MGTEKKRRHVDEKHQEGLALILLYNRKFVSNFLPADACSRVSEEFHFIPDSNLSLEVRFWKVCLISRKLSNFPNTSTEGIQES